MAPLAAPDLVADALLAETVWTDEADQWLLKIHDYIAKDSPAAAFNVVQSIYERAQILERSPDHL